MQGVTIFHFFYELFYLFCVDVGCNGLVCERIGSLLIVGWLSEQHLTDCVALLVCQLLRNVHKTGTINLLKKKKKDIKTSIYDFEVFLLPHGSCF